MTATSPSAPVLDLLWRKLEDIHRHEVARMVARQKWTSEETRAAVEALSIGILRRVFSGWSATLLDSDPDKERARMIVELFDLPEAFLAVSHRRHAVAHESVS